MSISIDNCISTFLGMLDARLQAGIYTTEDSVRYTFFKAMLDNGVDILDVVLEYPHVSINQAEIDTVVFDRVGNDSMAFEFKYHRSLPGGKNQPRTQHAGAVLADIFRLASIPSKSFRRKFMIYITDAEMANYFSNPSNSFDSLFGLQRGEQFEFHAEQTNDYTPAIRAKIEGLACDCSVTGVNSAPLHSNHHVRVYEIHT